MATVDRGRRAARSRVERRDVGSAKRDALVERKVEGGRILGGCQVAWRGACW